MKQIGLRHFFCEPVFRRYDAVILGYFAPGMSKGLSSCCSQVLLGLPVEYSGYMKITTNLHHHKHY
jgi:hypothetical protein